MARTISGLLSGGLLMGVWAALWRSTDWPVLASGLVFPLSLAALTGLGRLGPDLPLRIWLRLDLWGAFLVLVALRVTAAVISTSWAVISGGRSPGIVAVPVRLRSHMGRLLLLWAVTVTPGTIALLLEGDLLYVHCLRRPPGAVLPGLPSLEGVLLRLWG
ncbi:hypothetical protein DRJ54_01040 [Candidatus Acetothermia bacterium]|nr:MAG: hypothetical protein DRJ54_01040 [Candidatus Acetothermia bacterium]